MKNIIIINGPNLQLLGNREPSIYGEISFDEYFNTIKKSFPNLKLSYFQSNSESEIIEKLNDASADGFVLNAAAYTHTSIALRDCIAGITKQVIEVHISNVYARESFRHHSLISPVCTGSISGFGLKSYELALNYFI